VAPVRSVTLSDVVTWIVVGVIVLALLILLGSALAVARRLPPLQHEAQRLQQASLRAQSLSAAAESLQAQAEAVQLRLELAQHGVELIKARRGAAETTA
jgi:hypothetical protein